jgi:hypothetical protein
LNEAGSRYGGLTRAQVIIACLLLAVLAALASGCAGTARGSRTSVFTDYQPVELNDYSLSRADALVVIRYPAIIHSDAELPYFHAFSINPIGPEVAPANRTKKVTTRIAQSVIAKSNYFVMSLFRELQRELPENTVLLSPHIILWDEKRGVYSRPILATEQIPSVLTVDFNVYSYPDPTALMDSPPVTFGDLVTPLFVVHSNRWLQPATHGLILSSEPLMGTAWRLSEQQSEHALKDRLSYAPQGYQRPLDFVSFIGSHEHGSGNVPRKGVGEARLETMAVEEYPVEKIQMDGPLLLDLAREYSRDPFAEKFVRGAAANIKTLLNEVDHDQATFFARQQALARFDPELAVAFLARSGGESVRARLRLAEALIEAERKFLSVQSVSLYDGTYEGDYGSQMREMIQGEYQLLESRRSMARKQNVTAAFAALAMAGSIYAATASGAVGGIALQTFSAGLALSSLWAMSSTLETRGESSEMSENFLALIAPALERQISVQMEWLESKERISAIGFAEFRNKTLTLYQSRIRSLQGEFQDDCLFSAPGFSDVGRWYGSCRDGYGHGRGYGVLQDASGNSIEYLGAAERGLPNGIGGMIAQNGGSAGATFYEGRFRNGRPDGILRVEEPGRKPRVREFRAGKDVGGASESEWKGLTF